MIEDFKHGEDIIELDHDEFGALDPGPPAASAFHDGSHATTPDQRIIYNSDGVLFYDPDGTGPLHKVAFARLPGHPSLHHTDFDVESDNQIPPGRLAHASPTVSNSAPSSASPASLPAGTTNWKAWE